MTSFIRRVQVKATRRWRTLKHASAEWWYQNTLWLMEPVRVRRYWAQRLGRYADYLQELPEPEFGDTISAPDLVELKLLLRPFMFLPFFPRHCFWAHRLSDLVRPYEQTGDYVQYTTRADETLELARFFHLYRQKASI